MKNLDPEQQRTHVAWTFWFQWIMATTLGWLAGFLIGEAALGAAIGVAQWLILRREVINASWWILVSTVAWFVGWQMIVAGLVVPPGGGIISSLTVGAVVGLLVGIGQWFVLRRWTHYASLWIVTNVSAWSIGFSGLFGGPLVSGLVVGAATGLVLDFLLRYPRDDVSSEN